MQIKTQWDNIYENGYIKEVETIGIYYDVEQENI